MQSGSDPKISHLSALDGIRGLAALWVLLGHAATATGFHVPGLCSPNIAVDVFITASGFLMVNHYYAREAREPWSSPATWRAFWLRRFFRIAPTYYAALAIALLLTPLLSVAIQNQANFTPEKLAPFSDHSLANVLNHVTFAFGLLPRFHGSTPLPDWSIGLEMQFYAAFPLLILLARRVGWVSFSVLVVAVAWAICIAFSDYAQSFVTPAELNEPSPLFEKIHIFAAGMLVAAGLQQPERRRLYFLLGAILSTLPFPGPNTLSQEALRVGCVGMTGLLINPTLADGHLRGLLSWGAEQLGKPPFRFLADMSYGVYLLHIPILTLMVSALGAYRLPAPLWFASAAVLTMAIAYGGAWLLHRTVEKPSIALGRRVVDGFRKRPLVAATA